jgi:2-iminobutanoate/2-iminopropanoate deaminase
MERVRISTENAPAALGPYSQAIVSNGFVFCSGTVGIDPQTGELADGLADQTARVLVNLTAILEAAGTSMDGLVKTTIFYADVNDLTTINEIYGRHMPDPPPARSAPANVQLPRGILISIEAVAVTDG